MYRIFLTDIWQQCCITNAYVPTKIDFYKSNLEKNKRNSQNIQNTHAYQKIRSLITKKKKNTFI